MSAVALGAIVLGGASPAWGHEGDHAHMPNLVIGGVTGLSAARWQLRDANLDERSVAGVGAIVGYARGLGDDFELGLRGAFLKPFPGRADVDKGLFELRASLDAAVAAPLIDKRLELVVGFEAGALLERLVLDDGARHAGGPFVGARLALRGWLTHHTGLWGELGADYGRANDADLDVERARALRLTLGWADRF